MKKILIIIVLGLAGILIYQHSRHTPSVIEKPSLSGGPAEEVIAQNLHIPWGVDFLPTGEILVTERPGNLLIIKQDKTVIKVDGVKHIGEGGLLGVAVHPKFSGNHWIYLYSTSQSGSQVTNRVE